MDHFTPPAHPAVLGANAPSISSSVSIISHTSSNPPPLPPPPTDLPEGYRASFQTDAMPGITKRSGQPLEEEWSLRSPPTSPEPSAGRPRRGSFGFLPRSISRGHEVPTVTSSSGQTMLRKQKLRAAEEERLRQERESRPPPQLPSHSPLPSINTFGGEETRPDSIAIASNRATSNFSRPYAVNPNSSSPSSHMAGSASLPVLNKQPGNFSSPTPYQRSSGPRDNMSNNGEYIDSRTRINSMASGHHSIASSAIGNVNSPRRVRRRKDPTPFK